MIAGSLLFILRLNGILEMSEYTWLLSSGLLTTVGLVMCQSVATTLAVEYGKLHEKVGEYQVNLRIAVSIGSILAAVISGPVAIWGIHVASYIRLAMPIILLCILFLTPMYEPKATGTIDWKLLSISGAFILLCLIVHNQYIIFAAQFLLLAYLLWYLSNGDKTFLLICLAIFLFRVTPGYGPGYNWWLIGGLGFNESFLGVLRIVSTVVDLGTVLLIGKWIARANPLHSLTALTVLGAILSLPDFIVYYKLSTIDPHYILFLDTALVAPLADLSMIILGVIIAAKAPVENTATYMAVTASFMNCALLGGDLLTKYVNDIYSITRSDFTQLGGLMITSFTLGLALSIVGIVMLYVSQRRLHVNAIQ
jgi:ABC-type multidrug transport system fused ATPase/permease subunit